MNPMLSLLRKNTKKIFILILFLLVPPFCFFGLDIAFRSLFSIRIAGKLYGKPISIDRFFLYQMETRHQLMVQMAIYFGIQTFDQFSNLRTHMEELFPGRNIPQLTWERILLTQLADRYQIPSSENEVASWMARFPLFQSGGRFDPQRYQTFVRNAFGSSTLQFEKELEKTLRIERLRRLITDGVHLSEEEIRAAFAQQEEKAATSLVLFNGDDYAKGIELTEKEILDHYQSNPEAFRVPEKVRIRYLTLKKGDKDSEETFFDRATELSLAFIKNPNAEEVAKEFATKVEETGLFSRHEKTLPAAVVEQAFALEIADYSRPLQVEDVVYVLTPVEKKESYVPAFEECRQEVEAALRKLRARDKAREAAEKSRQELAERIAKDKVDFAEAVRKQGLVLQKPPEFTRQQEVPKNLVPLQMQQLAFTLPLKQLSPVIATETGAAIFVVEERKLPEFKKDPVLVEKLRNEKKMIFYQNWIAYLKREANWVDLTPFIR